MTYTLIIHFCVDIQYYYVCNVLSMFLEYFTIHKIPFPIPTMKASTIYVEHSSPSVNTDYFIENDKIREEILN